MISVDKIDERTFEVTVRDETTTRHRVTLQPEDHARLAGPRVSAETLIERSFEFLLEREGNEDILRSFDLTVIARYFPEYEREIRSRL